MKIHESDLVKVEDSFEGYVLAGCSSASVWSEFHLNNDLQFDRPEIVRLEQLKPRYVSVDVGVYRSTILYDLIPDILKKGQ